MKPNMREDLRTLQSMKAPEALKERTWAAVQAARQGAARAPGKRRGAPWIKRTVVAACLLLCALGGMSGVRQLRESGPNDGKIPAGSGASNAFGLVAYAADRMVAPQDGKLVFETGDGQWDGKNGFFSGSLFQLTGENIASFHVEIDRGGIYRQKQVVVDRATPEGEHAYLAMQRGEAPSIAGADAVMLRTLTSDEEETRMAADACWVLGKSFDEPYEPDALYGFWMESAPQPEEEDDLRGAWFDQTDRFDGATMTLTVTFLDGTTADMVVRLQSGKLKVDWSDDDRMTVLPELATADEPYVYAIYGEIEEAES